MTVYPNTELTSHRVDGGAALCSASFVSKDYEMGGAAHGRLC